MAITRLGRHERVLNGWVDSLNGGINDTVTTLTVNDATGTPTGGDWRLLIGTEILLVTSRASNVLTVVRGQEGTSAASHSDAAEVTAVATATGITTRLLDCYGVGFSRDTPQLDRPHGRMWDKSGTVLTESSFTWLNQGTATASDNNGILMAMPSEASHNVRGKYVTAPSTSYSVKCKIRFGPGFGTPGASGSHMGIFFRESSTNKLVTLSCYYGGDIEFRDWTGVTARGSLTGGTVALSFLEDALWLEIVDDGTYIIGRASHDGANYANGNPTWTGHFKELRTTHMAGGADQVGFYANSGSGSAGALFHFESFTITP